MNIPKEIIEKAEESGCCGWCCYIGIEPSRGTYQNWCKNAECSCHSKPAEGVEDNCQVEMGVGRVCGNGMRGCIVHHHINKE